MGFISKALGLLSRSDKNIKKLPHEWQVKDGRKVLIKNMGTVHIMNCMRLLERNYRNIILQDKLNLMAYLDGDPPDGATMCAERELEELDEWETPDFPVYQAFEKELEKRSINAEGESKNVKP